MPPSDLSRAADAGPLGADVSFLLARANALAATKTNTALSVHRLRVRSYAVLAMVGSGARMNQREIADYLRLDPSQVVTLVDDLQARDLVSRTPDPRDRRTNLITATDAGASVLAEARLAVEESERTTYSGLNPDELVQFAGLLRRVAFAD